MKNLLAILIAILLTATICQGQTEYDPPSGYTTYYHLRMWDEGDRPGADSVNQNLKDIDFILKAYVMHLSGNEMITGLKKFTNKMEIGTAGSTLSTDSSTKIYTRTWFMNEAPYTNYAPSNNAQLTNKYYVDQSISTAGANYVLLTGTQEIAGAKTFTNSTTSLGTDAIGDVYLNMIATDNAKIQYNGATFLTWDATTLTVGGVVDAAGYKVSGTTAYLTSAFGEPTTQAVWVSTTNGGSPTKQLSTVDLTINGAKYKVLIEN